MSIPNRKSILHLLKYTANIYLSRCSTDLRWSFGTLSIYEAHLRDSGFSRRLGPDLDNVHPAAQPCQNPVLFVPCVKTRIMDPTASPAFLAPPPYNKLFTRLHNPGSSSCPRSIWLKMLLSEWEEKKQNNIFIKSVGDKQWKTQIHTS